MFKRILVKTARIVACVILGVVLGLSVPILLEQFLPGYKYYGAYDE